MESPKASRCPRRAPDGGADPLDDDDDTLGPVARKRARATSGAVTVAGDMEAVTCRAPVNIAVIKYWGKRDENLILPINDSISCTLSMEHMNAKTTIMASPKFKDDRFWLNGVIQSFDNKRLANCIQEIQAIANGKAKYHLRICSENNFPTAAGLASSAAGYACLVTALANLYDIKADLSLIARRGSGSACRSVHGGWVRWHMGENLDGSDSIAREIASYDHWPEMRVLVLVVDDSKKRYSSTSGMSQSVATSQLLKYRASTVVPDRVKRMLAAIRTKNFHDFAELTIADSNQFHAVCLDTYPPCVYMNDTSHAIADLVHGYNQYYKQNKAAYTFDAGPNACIFILEKNVAELMALINEYFPTTITTEGYYKGIPIESHILNLDLISSIKRDKYPPNSLRYIIHTCVGRGPTVSYDSHDHLLKDDGFPKSD